MKKYVSVTFLVNFLVLYGLSLSLFGSQNICSNNSSAKNRPYENESYYAISPLDSFRHCTKTENLINGFNNLPVTTLKKHFNAFSTKIKTAELFHVNEFAKYISYTKEAVIDFEQSDIIYPSHYFL